MPRVYDQTFAFNEDVHGLNLTDLMDEITPQDDESEDVSGLQLTSNGEVKKLKFNVGDFGFSYRERVGDKVFANSDPIIGLAGNAITFSSELGRVKIEFTTGHITDETLLSSDPALSNTYTPADLGGVQSAKISSDFSILDSKLSLGVGFMNEEDTVLGAQSDGLFDMGGGKTAYGTAELKIGAFAFKYSIARTTTSPGYGVIESMSDLYSDAYSMQANFGKWSFNLSRPLAVTSGSLKYATMDYEIVDADNGYDLNTDPYLDQINLAPENRETMASLLYRMTDNLAFGVVERLNPNNTSGHEEVVMMKFKTIW